jgi:hypothetical protein
MISSHEKFTRKKGEILLKHEMRWYVFVNVVSRALDACLKIFVLNNFD